MIDQQLINSNVDRAKTALTDAQPSEILGLYRVNNFFTGPMLDKFKTYVNNSKLTWHDMESLINLYNTPLRKKINWDRDTVIEELHEVCASQTQLINTIFTEKKLKFSGISIWRDIEGYFIDNHYDNPFIAVSLQIYLTELTTCDLGTTFFNDAVQAVIAGDFNSGYLASNMHPIKHRTTNVVPPKTIRYSLHAIWSEA